MENSINCHKKQDKAHETKDQDTEDHVNLLKFKDTLKKTTSRSQSGN